MTRFESCSRPHAGWIAGVLVAAGIGQIRPHRRIIAQWLPTTLLLCSDGTSKWLDTPAILHQTPVYGDVLRPLRPLTAAFFTETRAWPAPPDDAAASNTE